MAVDLKQLPQVLLSFAYDIQQFVSREGALEHIRSAVCTWSEGLQQLERVVEQRQRERDAIMLASHWAYTDEFRNAPTCKPEPGSMFTFETLYRRVSISAEMQDQVGDPKWLRALAYSLAMNEPETFTFERASETSPDQIEIGFEFGSWMPPRLSVDSDPEIEDPLPLPDRALSQEEGYAVLAAIHDEVTRGVPKIDPWALIHEGDDSIEMYLERLKRGYTHYLRLRDRVENLEAADEMRLRPVLHAALRDFEAFSIKLTDRQRRVLQVLWEGKAFSQEFGIKRLAIAERADGKGASEDAYDDELAALRQLALVESFRGRSGGAVLTNRGRTHCRKLFRT